MVVLTLDFSSLPVSVLRYLVLLIIIIFVLFGDGTSKHASDDNVYNALCDYYVHRHTVVFQRSSI